MKEEQIRPGALFSQYLELARQDAFALAREAGSFISVPCVACGSAMLEPTFTKHGFRWVVCLTCGSLQVNPRPSPDQLAWFYREGESVKFWSNRFYRETAEERRVRMFRPRAELIGRLASSIEASDPSVADVGAGFGILLEEVARLRIFRRIVAIEPNAELAERCRQQGFDVIEAAIEQVPAGESRFDIMSCFEVLEHVFDPSAFLTSAARLLQPGGLMVFTTLVSSGFDVQVLWEHSNSASPPHHLNLVTTQGMRTLIARSGLDLVELTTPGRLDVDIVRNAVRDNPELRVPRFIRSLIGSEAAAEAFQDFLVAHELSSHVRVVVRKPCPSE